MVGEVSRLSSTASRRLQLAAEASSTMAIIVRRWRRQQDAADFGQPTAATTRWRVSPLPSSPLPTPGVGRARWFVELIRCKAGERRSLKWKPLMRRVVSLYLPTWPTDRLRRRLGKDAPPAEAPVVLIGRSGSQAAGAGRQRAPPRGSASTRRGGRQRPGHGRRPCHSGRRPRRRSGRPGEAGPVGAEVVLADRRRRSSRTAW